MQLNARCWLHSPRLSPPGWQSCALLPRTLVVNPYGEHFFVIASHLYAAKVAVVAPMGPDSHFLDFSLPLQWLTLTDVHGWCVVPWRPSVNQRQATRGRFGLVSLDRAGENLPLLAWALCRGQLLAWQIKRFVALLKAADQETLLQALLRDHPQRDVYLAPQPEPQVPEPMEELTKVALQEMDGDNLQSFRPEKERYLGTLGETGAATTRAARGAGLGSASVGGPSTAPPGPSAGGLQEDGVSALAGEGEAARGERPADGEGTRSGCQRSPRRCWPVILCLGEIHCGPTSPGWSLCCHRRCQKRWRPAGATAWPGRTAGQRATSSASLRALRSQRASTRSSRRAGLGCRAGVPGVSASQLLVARNMKPPSWFSSGCGQSIARGALPPCRKPRAASWNHVRGAARTAQCWQGWLRGRWLKQCPEPALNQELAAADSAAARPALSQKLALSQELAAADRSAASARLQPGRSALTLLEWTRKSFPQPRPPSWRGSRTRWIVQWAQSPRQRRPEAARQVRPRTLTAAALTLAAQWSKEAPLLAPCPLQLPGRLG